MASNTVPAVCDSSCNAILVYAQAEGFVSALCQNGGQFQQDYSSCQECVDDYATKAPKDIVLLIPSVVQYVDYCATDNDAFAIIAASASSLQGVESSLTSALSSASSESSVLCYASASLGAISSAVCAVVSTSLAPNSTIFLTRTLPRSTPSLTHPTPTSALASQIPTLTPHRSNNGTIIGAAVGGSVGGLLVIGPIVGFFMMRRRSKPKAATAVENQPTEKSQLHSDDYKPYREEMLGDLGKKQYDHTVMSEMPSNEPVEGGKEMPVHEEVGVMLDNRVRIPKTDESSEATKTGSGS